MIARKQTPPNFAHYSSYKRFLRLDFEYRCAYCKITEYRWGSERNFVVEHFRPQALFPSLITDYSKLYYACNRCNDCKGDSWPTADEEALGYGLADPCACDFVPDHMREEADGTLTPESPVGEYTIESLRLNRTYLVAWRKERRQLLADIAGSFALIKQIEEEVFPDASPSGVQLLTQLIAFQQQLCERLRLEY